MGRYENEIKAFHDALERAYNDGYKDGAENAKRQILNAISSEPASHTTPEMPKARAPIEPASENVTRKRAPRGLPRALTMRTLKANPSGVTPQQIVEAAETDFEKMIAVSSIRSELRKGEKDERYVEIDGLWHLAESDEAEGQTLASQPSASNSNQERKHYAPSVVDDDLI